MQIALPAGQPRLTVLARAGQVAVAEDLVRPGDLFRRWHGIVRNQKEKPISGAVVAISGARSVSDIDGRFDCGIPANVQGPLTLRVSANGYVPFRRAIKPSRDNYCECGSDGVEVILKRGGRVSLRILDRGQRPVPNAVARLYSETGLADFAKGGPRPVPIMGGRSDEQGVVRINGAPQSCDVMVEYRSSSAVQHREIRTGVPAGMEPLTITLDRLDVAVDTANLVLRITDGLTGRVFAEKVFVEATSKHGVVRRLAPSPKILMKDMALGNWVVTVTAVGLGSRSAPLNLRVDQSLDIELGRGPSIEGRVSRAQHLKGSVQISTRESMSGRALYTRSDALGNFKFAGVQAGTYQLSVDAFESGRFGHLPVRRPQSHASTNPVTVTVSSQGTMPAVATLPVVTVAPLRVVVYPVDGQDLWWWAQGLRFTVTDSEGDTIYRGRPSELARDAATLYLNIPDGSYNVAVKRRGDLLGYRALTAGETWNLKTR